MATDKSPVRFALIGKVAVISIVTLVAVRVALASYFDHYVQVEEMRKVGEAKPEALLALRADERERLSGGHTPIDSAMQQLAKRGRANMSPELTPTVSHDVGPLQGWVKMPGEVPARMGATADAGALVEAPEAGIPNAGDAGPAKNAPAAAPAKADAGPPHKKSP
jgi:hypothetical protein